MLLSARALFLFEVLALVYRRTAHYMNARSLLPASRILGQTDEIGLGCPSEESVGNNKKLVKLTG